MGQDCRMKREVAQSMQVKIDFEKCGYYQKMRINHIKNNHRGYLQDSIIKKVNSIEILNVTI